MMEVIKWDEVTEQKLSINLKNLLLLKHINAEKKGGGRETFVAFAKILLLLKEERN